MNVEKLREKIVKKELVSKDIANRLKESEVIQYIFHAGFSNAEQITTISGRGVGMDVVKRAVESVGGQVRVKTELSKGSTISMELPASLALKGTLMVALGEFEYAIGLSFSEAVVKVRKEDLTKLGHTLIADFKRAAITAVFLADLFDADRLDDLKQRGSLQKSFNTITKDQIFDMVVVNYGDRKTGIIVDRVIQQKEMIEKPLEKPLNNIKLISGTSIMGSGKVCPIIDIGFVIELIYDHLRQYEEVIG